MHKSDHGPEEKEAEKRETESKMENLAETSCLTYRQIFDENVSSPKAKLQRQFGPSVLRPNDS